MFGKPQWFKKKKFGWGLVPVTCQGWVYAFVWGLVIAGPFIVLLLRQQFIESSIWMLAAIALLCWDVVKIIAEMDREERKNLFYIGDDEADSAVAMKNFDLEVRDEAR